MPGTVVVVNPHSAGARPSAAGPSFARSSTRRTARSKRVHRLAGHGDPLTREALQGGADLVVAVGGDGTINEVVNGFFDGDERRSRPAAAFGVLPAGTGGDFIKTLGIRARLRAPPRAAQAAPRRARSTSAASTSSTTTAARQVRHFINIASLRHLGHGRPLRQPIVQERSAARSRSALATMRAGVSYKNAAVRLTLDGGPPQRGQASTTSRSPTAATSAAA